MGSLIDRRSILDDLINDISDKYFNLDDLDMNRVSNYGYVSEAMAKSIEDTMNINITRIQNYVPELATNETIVRETAKLRNLSISSAVPSIATAIITIVKEDIIQRGSLDSNGMVTFYIDKRSYIVNDNTHYALVADIIIRAIPSPLGGYIYSASYTDATDSFIQSYDDYLEDGTLVMNMLVSVNQMKYNIQEQIVVDKLEFLYSGLIFEYTNELAGFNVYYKTGNNSQFQLLDKMYYLNPLSDELTNTIFYNDDEYGVIRILNNQTINLQQNTVIKIEMMETLGETDSLAIGIDTTSFELYKDATYSYTGVGIYADILEIVSLGTDGDDLNEIKRKLIREKIYRNNITTDKDIVNYVDDIDSNVYIVKKRIDLIDRLYTIYTLLRDGDYIIPATTKNTIIGEVEFDYIDPVTGIKYLNSDNKYLVGLDKIARKTTIDNEDERCISVPFLTVFDSDNIPYFYYQTMNELFYLTPLINNMNNPYQAITRSLSISRDQFDVNKRYDILTNITLNTSNDKSFVDDDGNILDMDSIKAFILLRNNDEIVAYGNLNLVSYSKDDRIFKLSGGFNTDDLITDDKKIHIVEGLYDLGTTDIFTGLIDYSNIVFDIYYMVKNNVDLGIINPTISSIHTMVPGYEDYTFMNSFDNRNKRANLLIEMNSFCRSHVSNYKNGVTEYDVVTKTMQLIEGANVITIDDFDPIRDYIIIALDGVMQINGVDYILTKDGFDFGSRVILPRNIISYFIYKNYDDATLRYYERTEYVIQDDNYSIPLVGYLSTDDLVRIYSDIYGYLVEGTDYTISVDNRAVLNIVVKNSDKFIVEIFKNNQYIDTQLLMEEDVTYKLYNSNLYELILPDDTYSLESDYIDILTNDNTVLRKNIDYFIMYDSTVLLSTDVAVAGDIITIKVIKEFKGPRNIIVGNISPPNDLVVVPNFNVLTDTIELYRKGELLVEDIDYRINADNSISLLSFTTNSRKDITYRLFKDLALSSYEVEKDYVKINGIYTSKQYNLSLITIPNFDSQEDGIQLYKNNLLLINPDDYIIQDDGNILLTSPITLGDVINFSIIKVYDVTNKLRITDIQYTMNNETTLNLSTNDTYYSDFNYIEVSIYQTMLRVNEDYTINGNIITFNESIDNKVDIRLYKAENAQGKIIDMIYTEYEATEDNILYIPLPEYNSDTDTLLNVNYNQTSLIYGRDYGYDINRVSIETEQFTGISDNIVLYNGLDEIKDFIRVYKNNKIINPDEYVITSGRILLNDIVPTDIIVVDRYMNMKTGDVTKIYTKNIIINQNNQRYIYDADVNYLNAIYYNGEVLRNNIDYIVGNGTVTIYNQSFNIGDKLVFERMVKLDSALNINITYYTYSGGNRIEIISYDHNTDKVVVNYEGRILHEDIDFRIEGNNIVLFNIIPLSGDLFHYTIFKNFKLLYISKIDGIVLKDFAVKIGDKFTFGIIKPVREDVEIITSAYTNTIQFNSSKIPIDKYNAETDYLLLNYNQTILSEGLHYIKNDDNSISFIDETLSSGDVLYFIVVKNIRKILDIETGYVSGPENLVIIPDYDRLYDKLVLVADGRLLTETLDFTVDENNKVIFNGNITVTPETSVHYKIFKYYLGDEFGSYSTMLIEVPFIQSSYLKDNLQVIYDKVVQLYATYNPLVFLVTGIDINLKFTSTFGDSDYIYIMDEELNNLNPVLRFIVYGTDIDVSELKEFIISYFRDTYINENIIFISNICRLIETEFEEVRGITYLGTDNFGSLYQKISYKTPDLTTTENILKYIPECLNINNIIIEVEEIK